MDYGPAPDPRDAAAPPPGSAACEGRSRGGSARRGRRSATTLFAVALPVVASAVLLRTLPPASGSDVPPAVPRPPAVTGSSAPSPGDEGAYRPRSSSGAKVQGSQGGAGTSGDGSLPEDGERPHAPRSAPVPTP
ncbi:hypothetical protein AGRA3207_001572 [Actinomadura graeca]|uniref:Serine/threonine protein kinase n=1 Tax=Actinomadura graeca TaxID=2750812 RepID=A0ABX8QSR8_9ACTN|nr:hypothetical protein [Actinomadura graeca]QXJ20797.1 hypothetical protein AGRA3207_001572 [Actinomadura graeca]